MSEELITVLILAAIALEVWLLYLFVNMCKDVRSIEKSVAGSNTTAYDWVDIMDVKLAVLQGQQEKLYNRIVSCLFMKYQKCFFPKNGTFIRWPDHEDMDARVREAEEYCKLLGYKLPDQLKSLDAFQDYCNEKS